MVGPNSATDGHLALFDGATGKLLKDGGVNGGGTVTSVGVSNTGGGLAITGSPVTISGTIDIELDTSTLDPAPLVDPLAQVAVLQPQPSSVTVAGAGTSAVNGVYEYSGLDDTDNPFWTLTGQTPDPTTHLFLPPPGTSPGCSSWTCPATQWLPARTSGCRRCTAYGASRCWTPGGWTRRSRRRPGASTQVGGSAWARWCAADGVPVHCAHHWAHHHPGRLVLASTSVL